jgi:hypothetical protein
VQYEDIHISRHKPIVPPTMSPYGSPSRIPPRCKIRSEGFVSFAYTLDLSLYIILPAKLYIASCRFIAGVCRIPGPRYTAL